jgi:uncharacterized membrane protein YfcA
VEFLLAIFAGTFIGAVLGFIGAGGAMLTVPILIYIFDFTPAAATTAALAVVFAAALAGAYPKARAKAILYKEAFVIWSLGLITNIGASLLAHKLSSSAITTGFAIILIAAGTSMLRKPTERPQTRISNSRLVLLSLFIGCITGFFGIGGGFVVIPLLTLAFGTPLNIAAGTSLAVIAANSLTAFFGHYALWSDVSWSIPMVIAIFAMAVASTTSRINSKVNPRILKQSFAGLLYIVALFTIFKTWVL